MSTGARIEREARKLGRKEGREEGRVDLFLRQLTARFGPPSEPIERRVRSARAGEVDRWAIALLTAASLEQVFAESR